MEAQRFWAAEPFGDQRADWHAAQITQACLAPWSKKKLRMEKLKLTFRKQQSASEQISQAAAFAARFNAGRKK